MLSCFGLTLFLRSRLCLFGGVYRGMAAFNFFYRGWFVILFDLRAVVIRPNRGGSAACAAAQTRTDGEL